MDGRPAGPLCCGRCGGPAVAARAARRQRFRAAVFARPGGNLPSTTGAAAAGGAAGPASAAAAGGAASPGGTAGPAGGGGAGKVAVLAGRPGDIAAGPASTARPANTAGPGSAGRFATVTGTLLDASPHTLIVATTAGERRFALTAAAPIWRGGTARASELRPGERVVIRVVPGRRDVAD